LAFPSIFINDEICDTIDKNIDDVKLNFGKHNGKTFGEIRDVEVS
jgi:hypothetical protein